jgi:hypothetical protein
MATNGNHLPRPEAIWIALAFVVWAVAAALGAQRRARFIDALAAVTQNEDARRRVVAINSTNGRRRAVTANVQVAVTYVSRIVAELRAADR